MKYYCGLKTEICGKKGPNPCQFSDENCPREMVDRRYVLSVRNLDCKSTGKKIFESLYEAKE
jgi:hypothetical protein